MLREKKATLVRKEQCEDIFNERTWSATEHVRKSTGKNSGNTGNDKLSKWRFVEKEHLQSMEELEDGSNPIVDLIHTCCSSE